jgi:leader peptidase (prepilin peptidase) / N-methyltransferase
MRFDELTGLIPLWLLRVAVFSFGLLWGSFLNVVIYRVPRDMSVVRPASHCPGCGKPVAGYDNIPVLSYLILRGRARCCGARMSPRYPLVELIGGALSLAIFEVIILRLPSGVSVGRASAIYGADFALALGLVAAAFIDAEHMFLPDRITLGGVVLGVFTASLRDLGWLDALLGAGIGFVGVWFPFTFLYKGLLGRTGMGLGDAKLLALAGAWFGWPGAVFALFAGAIQGTLYALVTRLLGIELKLPDAVQEDIAELEKRAAEGDEEAKRDLEADPLAEDRHGGDRAFIVEFFKRLFGIKDTPKTEVRPKAGRQPEGPRAEAKADESEAEAEAEEGAPRARLPFGPFLILAMLEFLFAGPRISDFLYGILSP